jgi:uncharacterized protein
MVAAILPFILASASVTAIPDISAEVKAIAKELETGSSSNALARLEQLAAQKDDSATVLLGEIYFFGLYRIPPDRERGCDYFEPLASRYGEVAHNLATCYFNAVGDRTDLATARVHYKKAMELGFPDSACALGNMMISGKGGEVDVAAGLNLCRAAAEKGLAHAQTDYGTYLLLGKIVPKDVVAARQWLEKAALQNHGNASFLLGQIYWKGDGIAEDRVTAAKWWKVAFANGRADAAFMLAREAMARMVVKNDEKMTISREVLPEAIYWLEESLEVEGRTEEKAENRKLLDSLYELRDGPNKGE